ncbi:MAG: hypothetical protein JO078_10135 [Candidatus Eremiobacteraeota bacterium]|nr:hypothetical protein [Candidatus Eremiobacteraeota bacterium]
MHNRLSIVSAAAAIAVLVPGCSPVQIASPMLPSRGAATLRSSDLLQSLRPTTAKRPQVIYIGDYTYSEVKLLHNKTYQDVGVIQNGVSGPIDVFLDNRARLYVANYAGANVTEYAPGNTGGPIFTYSAGMTKPLAVTVDTYGNVFEADTNGRLNEFFQGQDVDVASCSVGNPVTGVAVDSNGDVFISFSVGNGAQLAEYVGGLQTCSESVLPVSLPAAAGLALDNNSNLLVASNSNVAVIAPPYTTVTSTIGSFAFARDVRLNKTNTLAFVSDRSTGEVTILNYPGGTTVKVLGTANGILFAESAVDTPNAVY